MPIVDIMFVSLVVSAFVSFALVLGWGSYQTGKGPAGGSAKPI
jgi:hypothetical protein